MHDGESHYQYLMRKKREAAEEAEFQKQAAREEAARVREEKLQEEWDYRQRLEEEYADGAEGGNGDGDGDGAMGDLENMAAGSDGSRSRSYSSDEEE